MLNTTPTSTYMRRSPGRLAAVIAIVVCVHVLGVLIFLNFGHKIHIPDQLIRVTIVK